MTTVVDNSWTNAVSGAYAVAANWSPNSIPTYAGGVQHTAFIGGAYTSGSAAFTVTSSASAIVGFLDVESNATLSITGGAFTVYSYVSSFSNVYNFGTINVGASASLGFGSATSANNASTELQNVGTVSIAGSMALAALYFELVGGGVFKLSGSILGARTGAVATLTNHNNTIQGSGVIGNGAALRLVNHFGGTINANGGNLTINTGANRITNAGLIETTGAGVLILRSNIENDGVLQSAGTGNIQLINLLETGGGATNVGAGTALYLNNAQISSGGPIAIAANASIRTTAGNTIGIGASNAFAGDMLQDGEIQDAGSILVVDNSTLNLNAAVLNAGKILLQGATHATKLEVFGDGVTLANTGGTYLSNSVNNLIVSNGSAVTLSNQTMISGAGVFGDGWLRLVNHVGATVSANLSSSLTIVADTAGVAAGKEKENFNAGTIINTGAGGLILSGGTFNNAGYLTENGVGALTLNGVNIDAGGGIVRALKGSIVLKGNSQITSQANVLISAGASLTTTALDTNDGLYGFLANNGAVNVVANSTLGVNGHWTNAGAINVGDASGGATIRLSSPSDFELLGGGTLNMANAADSIVSAGAGALFLDRSNLITGGGTIGDANMQVNITSTAKVDATLASGMTLTAMAQDASGTHLYNAGVLQSDSAGGLTLQVAIYSPGQIIANAGGKVIAQGAVYGPGDTIINGTGSVEFKAEVDNDVHFGATTGGQLILDASPTFYGAIFGLAAGDSIDLRDFAFVAGQTVIDPTASGFGTLDAGLTLTNGTSQSAHLWLQGNYTPAYLTANHLAFQFASDGHVISGTSSNGTLIKLVATA